MARHKDAVGIVDPGAINPSGICHSIISACQEVRDEGGDVRSDPAIRLMVHQLGSLCGFREMDDLTTSRYGEALRFCRDKSRVSA